VDRAGGGDGERVDGENVNEKKAGTREIRFADLFSGIGGFRLGLERVGGFRCIWSCDNNKYANQIYIKRFGKENHHTGDARLVEAEAVPDHDLLCAGFPCQAFSIAGKRKGFEDARGTLFYEIARIARAKRPTLLLLENVRGILSHDAGQTFGTILEVLGRIGYRCEWQVLNSKWFGVPQNRERVFIIGHLRGGGSRPIFPITAGDEVVDSQLGKKDVVRTLRASGTPKQQWNHTYIVDFKNQRLREEAGTLKAEGTSPWSQGTVLLYLETANAVDQDSYLRFGSRPRDEKGKPQLLPIGYRRIRCLTPVECERLQGFPDGWTSKGVNEKGEPVKISDTQRYKTLGNAVTVNVIEFLGRKIREASS